MWSTLIYAGKQTHDELVNKEVLKSILQLGCWSLFEYLVSQLQIAKRYEDVIIEYIKFISTGVKQ